MLPRNTLLSGGHARRQQTAEAVRAGLSVACLIAFALTVHAKDSADAVSFTALRLKDVQRAEKVLAKLRQLDDAAAHDDAGTLRDRVAKLSPGLFITVADMHQSYLKTDLDTALYLYEEAARSRFTSADSTADCGRERRDIYLPLCLDLRGGTRRQLLTSKARLHARWAEAVVRSFRGGDDAETLRALSAMKAARANDMLLTAQVMKTLKTLEETVNTFLTTDAEGQRVVSRVAFDKLNVKFAEALKSAGALLAAMPRCPAFYSLSRAWRGYQDGLFWYQKVHQSKRLVVAANGFAPDPLKDLRLDANQVTDTVVANWKAAVKSTRAAEQSLSNGT